MFRRRPCRLRAVTQLNDVRFQQPATAPKVGSLFTWFRSRRRYMALHLGGYVPPTIDKDAAHPRAGARLPNSQP
jgi:hypothetical protein